MGGNEAGRRIASGGAWLRLGISLLAFSALSVGVWALVAPRSFHDDFPGSGRGWVSAFGPYNEHLVRDVGALNLALGVLLVLAAILLERWLVRAALVAWLVYALPHLAFHATELDALPLLDNLLNLISLGIAVVLPSVLLLATRDAGCDADARRALRDAGDAP